MKPAENIKQLIENAKIVMNPETKKAALAELINELEKPAVVSSDGAKPNIWRLIMKSKAAKIAAAAVIVVLLLPLFSITILRERSSTKMDTSPHYILSNVQNSQINLKEMVPCKILPVIPD